MCLFLHNTWEILRAGHHHFPDSVQGFKRCASRCGLLEGFWQEAKKTAQEWNWTPQLSCIPVSKQAMSRLCLKEVLTSRQKFLINDSSVFGLQTLDGFVRNCTVQLGYFHSQRCQCLAKKDQKELEMTLNDLFRPCRKGLGMMKCCLNRAISTRVRV